MSSGEYKGTIRRNERNWLLVITAISSILIHLMLYWRISDVRFYAGGYNVENYAALTESPSRIDRLLTDPEKPLPPPELSSNEDMPTIEMQRDDLSEIIPTPIMEFETPPPQEAMIEAPNITEKASSQIKPDDSIWQPRNEIIKITERIADEDLATLPRLEILDIERVDSAPDYVPAIDITKDLIIPLASDQLRVAPSQVFSRKDIEETTESAVTVANDSVATKEDITPEVTLTQFKERPADLTDFKAVDNRLVLGATRYSPPRSDGRMYYRIEIVPRDEKILPTVPKDIIFVQDASRSLANLRLQFCKKGIIESFGFIGPEDRFNVAAFRDKTTYCFDSWVSPSEANIDTATSFVNALESDGETDLFVSFKSLTSLQQDAKRPLIVVIITDGKATKGLINSSEIIGEFSKLNDNMSVFVVGTQSRANEYLLDLISFCNRGTKKIVYNDRWSIPDAIKTIVATCANPVLGRVAVTTDIRSHSEIFPIPSANLYADKSLVFYGSCPEDVEKLYLQIRGEGGEAKCDSIFELNLKDVKLGTIDIKREWAKHKMYSLIGAYTRNPTPALLNAILDFRGESGMAIPYFNQVVR